MEFFVLQRERREVDVMLVYVSARIIHNGRDDEKRQQDQRRHAKQSEASRDQISDAMNNQADLKILRSR